MPRRNPFAAVLLATVAALLVPMGAAAQGAGIDAAPMPEDSTVIAMDLATTDTWTMGRRALQAAPDRLRVAMASASADDRTEEAIADAREALDNVVRVAPAMAPGQWPDIDRLAGRAHRLLDHVAGDYATGDARNLRTSLRLLVETLARIEELALLGDLEVGRRDTGFAHFPADWTPHPRPEPLLRTTLAPRTASELVAMLQDRRVRLNRMGNREFERDGPAIASELGEIARALVMRQDELNPLSREGFRNAALRADVVSENLIDFLAQRDWANARRQVNVMGDCIQVMDDYLAVNRRLE